VQKDNRHARSALQQAKRHAGKEMWVIRIFRQLCGYAATAFVLMGCHYDEEQSWRECCRLIIVDDAASSAAEMTIVRWHGGGMRYDPNGLERPPFEHDPWKKQEIASAVSEYLAGNPGVRADAYFVSLGMTCRAGSPKAAPTRCAIDLPIAAQCLSLNMFYPFGLPVPKELRKPFPAVLSVTVDVTASDIVGAHSQILPITGGRLCHR
jgi:hypothetical protein